MVKNSKTNVIVLILFFICLVNVFNCENVYAVKAVSNNKEISTYYIFDENDNLLAERYFVEEGDKIITNNLDEYLVFFVDNNENIALAKKTGFYT